MPRARSDRVIPVAPVDRLIRRAGAQRVSSSASERLAEILEWIGTQMAKEALRFAQHAKRSTVTSADIDAAFLQGDARESPLKISNLTFCSSIP